MRKVVLPVGVSAYWSSTSMSHILPEKIILPRILYRGYRRHRFWLLKYRWIRKYHASLLKMSQSQD
jgi:hypothetical protein